MIDIETLGNQSNSVITSIAGVEFDLDSGQTGKEFSINVDIQSCLDIGLEINASTLIWWFNQSKDAQMQMLVDPKPIEQALALLNGFIDQKSIVWGNSCRFDLGLLQNAYTKLKMEIPWRYSNERCVRTLLMFQPKMKDLIDFEGIPHNAMHDCYYQIKYCSAIYNKLKI